MSRAVHGLAVLACVAALNLSAARAAEPAEAKPLYADDPAVVKMLEGLGEHQSLRLPAFKVTGVGIDKDPYFAKRGPSGRDYGNKMAYAPDRGTAMYAGANHGAPSRLNDCWEFHLGSNTWIRLAVGDGGDHGRVYRARRAIGAAERLEKAGKPVDEKTKKAADDATAFMRKWYTDHVVLKDGYLQTKVNGGPVSPWHTWDGLAYDRTAKRLFWAVLDPDKAMQGKVRAYARWTDQDAAELLKQLKPGSSLYGFDPTEGRWFRQIGPGPHPYLRGMGGSLVYVPEWKKTVWYCAAQNVSPNDFAMWAYDSTTNRWEDLKPNGGTPIRTLVHGRKIAPGGEVQMAYSPKHRKIVAVQGKGTFVYDIDKNAWSAAGTEEGHHAHDAVTIFYYDAANDLFLFLNSPKGHWGNPRELRAFNLATKKWDTLPINGPDINKRPYHRMTGYYDPRFNVFVVYDSGAKVWVYRVNGK